MADGREKSAQTPTHRTVNSLQLFMKREIRMADRPSVPIEFALRRDKVFSRPVGYKCVHTLGKPGEIGEVYPKRQLTGKRGCPALKYDTYFMLSETIEAALYVA